MAGKKLNYEHILIEHSTVKIFLSQPKSLKPSFVNNAPGLIPQLRHTQQSLTRRS